MFGMVVEERISGGCRSGGFGELPQQSCWKLKGDNNNDRTKLHHNHSTASVGAGTGDENHDRSNKGKKRKENGKEVKRRQTKSSNGRGKINGGKKGRRPSKNTQDLQRQQWPDPDLANPPPLEFSSTPTFTSSNHKGKGKGRAKGNSNGNRFRQFTRGGNARRPNSSSMDSAVPWTRQRPRHVSDENLDRLGEEIERFEAYVLEWSARRRPFLLKIIRDIKRIVKRLFPSATVASYGSFVTGLSLPSSDLDLVAVGVTNMDSQQALGILAVELRSLPWVSKLNAILTASVPVIKFEACSTIPVPVRDAMPPTLGGPSSATAASSSSLAGSQPLHALALASERVVVDITFDRPASPPSFSSGSSAVPVSTPFPFPGASGPPSLHGKPCDPVSSSNTLAPTAAAVAAEAVEQGSNRDAQQPLAPPRSGSEGEKKTSSPAPPLAMHHTGLASVKLVRMYLRYMPSLRPLLLVLKQFLIERGLNSSYTGGLSSYCLVVMLVAYLRTESAAFPLPAKRRHAPYPNPNPCCPSCNHWCSLCESICRRLGLGKQLPSRTSPAPSDSASDSLPVSSSGSSSPDSSSSSATPTSASGIASAASSTVSSAASSTRSSHSSDSSQSSQFSQPAQPQSFTFDALPMGAGAGAEATQQGQSKSWGQPPAPRPPSSAPARSSAASSSPADLAPRRPVLSWVARVKAQKRPPPVKQHPAPNTATLLVDSATAHATAATGTESLPPPQQPSTLSKQSNHSSKAWEAVGDVRSDVREAANVVEMKAEKTDKVEDKAAAGEMSTSGLTVDTAEEPADLPPPPPPLDSPSLFPPLVATLPQDKGAAKQPNAANAAQLELGLDSDFSVPQSDPSAYLRNMPSLGDGFSNSEETLPAAYLPSSCPSSPAASPFKRPSHRSSTKKMPAPRPVRIAQSPAGRWQNGGPVQSLGLAAHRPPLEHSQEAAASAPSTPSRPSPALYSIVSSNHHSPAILRPPPLFLHADLTSSPGSPAATSSKSAAVSSAAGGSEQEQASTHASQPPRTGSMSALGVLRLSHTAEAQTAQPAAQPLAAAPEASASESQKQKQGREEEKTGEGSMRGNDFWEEEEEVAKMQHCTLEEELYSHGPWHRCPCKQVHPNGFPGQAQPQQRGLGRMLFGFLRFYARHFDFHSMGISLEEEFNNLTCFKYLPFPSQSLHISNPFSSSRNNLARSAFAMWRVCAAFDQGVSLLEHAPLSVPSMLPLLIQGPYHPASSTALDQAVTQRPTGSVEGMPRSSMGINGHAGQLRVVPAGYQSTGLRLGP